MLHPLTFHPLFKERIWGGRHLETLYGKTLPPGLRIGESWEITDRPGDESVIARGPLQGRTLGDLMREDSAALLGADAPAKPSRFPLLIKIIDAADTLSLQVHPPARVAAQLAGEPKTEMWYIAHAGPKAEIFVGLKRGIARSDFERLIHGPELATCFHRIPVHAGDAMFLPSGRVHALGAQNVIFEIQQNSDTTYRVFDWNRFDSSGKGRELHLPQSLASIDFDDFEPGLLPTAFHPAQPGRLRPLVKNNLFDVSLRQLAPGDSFSPPPGRMEIVGLLEGAARVISNSVKDNLTPGRFCLFPAQGESAVLQATVPTSLLEIFAGSNSQPVPA